MISKLISPYLKAHLAGLGAAFSLLIADLNAGGALTADKWYAIVGAFLGTAALVHVVPNIPNVPTVAAVASDVVDAADPALAPVLADVTALVSQDNG